MYTALLIDAGHLRASFKRCRIPFTVENIEAFANRCFHEDDTCYRIFYYDAPPYVGEAKRPVSQDSYSFPDKENMLPKIARLNNFAVRQGRLRFDGWRIKPNVLKQMSDGTFQGPVTDNHFIPRLAQKGVDMVLGLDVAAIADTRHVEQVMLVSADTDMAPALKYGRVKGLRVILIKPAFDSAPNLHQILLQHADIVKEVPVTT